MVWDSALDRTEIGSGIESRFTGTVTYYDRPEKPHGRRFWERERVALQTPVVLRLVCPTIGAAHRVDDHP